MTMTTTPTGPRGSIALRTSSRVYQLDGETYCSIYTYELTPGKAWEGPGRSLIGIVTYWRRAWDGLDAVAEWDELSADESHVIRMAAGYAAAIA